MWINMETNTMKTRSTTSSVSKMSIISTLLQFYTEMTTAVLFLRLMMRFGSFYSLRFLRRNINLILVQTDVTFFF